MATRIGRSPGAVVRRACSQVAAVAARRLRAAADGVPMTHDGAAGATTAYGLLLAVVTSMQIRSPLDVGGDDDAGDGGGDYSGEGDGSGGDPGHKN